MKKSIVSIINIVIFLLVVGCGVHDRQVQGWIETSPKPIKVINKGQNWAKLWRYILIAEDRTMLKTGDVTFALPDSIKTVYVIISKRYDVDEEDTNYSISHIYNIQGQFDRVIYYEQEVK